MQYLAHNSYYECIGDKVEDKLGDRLGDIKGRESGRGIRRESERGFGSDTQTTPLPAVLQTDS